MVRLGLLLLLVGLFASGCGFLGGEWESSDVGGVRIGDDRRTVEIVPTRYYSTSCTKSRGSAEIDGDVLRVRYETQRSNGDCTAEGGFPTHSSVIVQTKEPIPEGATTDFARGPAPVLGGPERGPGDRLECDGRYLGTSGLSWSEPDHQFGVVDPGLFIVQIGPVLRASAAHLSQSDPNLSAEFLAASRQAENMEPWLIWSDPPPWIGTNIPDAWDSATDYWAGPCGFVLAALPAPLGPQ